MRKPIVFFKVAALSSSVLLFGGCVAYRGGAFQSLLGTKAPSPVESRNAAPSVQPELWSGTKSLASKGVVAGLTPAGTSFPSELEQPLAPVPASNGP